MVFDFTVSGIPRTPGARTVVKWQAAIRIAANATWPYLQPAIDVEVSVTIVYFHFGETSIDVDNMSKPVLDALSPVYVKDDRLVVQLMARKTPLAQGLALTNPSPALAEGIETARANRSDFVYIKISDPPDHGQIP